MNPLILKAGKVGIAVFGGVVMISGALSGNPMTFFMGLLLLIGSTAWA
jgi:hypothetical protein